MIQYIYFIFSKQVQASRLEAEKDNVVVPTTMEEYCMKAKPLKPAQDRYVQCDCGVGLTLFCSISEIIEVETLVMAKSCG